MLTSKPKRQRQQQRGQRGQQQQQHQQRPLTDDPCIDDHLTQYLNTPAVQKALNVPTAVVVTTRDELVPPSRQYKLAASIPYAKVFEVEGDHFACARAAERFVPALLAACKYVTALAKAR